MQLNWKNYIISKSEILQGKLLLAEAHRIRIKK